MKSRSYYLAEKVMRAFIFIMLLAWAVIVLMPLYWMFVTAFRPDSLMMKMPPDMLSSSVTTKNFELLFTMALIGRLLFNSLFVAVLITLAAMIIDSYAGYALSIVKPHGHYVIFIVILACIMVPDQTHIVPLFIQIRQLWWYDTYQAQIIPFMGR